MQVNASCEMSVVREHGFHTSVGSGLTDKELKIIFVLNLVVRITVSAL